MRDAVQDLLNRPLLLTPVYLQSDDHRWTSLHLNNVQLQLVDFPEQLPSPLPALFNSFNRRCSIEEYSLDNLIIITPKHLIKNNTECLGHILNIIYYASMFTDTAEDIHIAFKEFSEITDAATSFPLNILTWKPTYRDAVEAIAFIYDNSQLNFKTLNTIYELNTSTTTTTLN